MKSCFKVLLSVLISAWATNTHAQKLPNKQEVSLRAPADIKIDGQATEWNNQYQAYNKNTEIFYTIANDDNNLYLVIHATNTRIIEKIIEGGVSFTLMADKKNTNNNIMLLFPLLSMNKARSILVEAGKVLSENMTSPAMQRTQPELLEKKATSIEKANKDLLESLKEIKLNGVSVITDTVPHVNSETPYYRFLPMRDHAYKIIGINNTYNIRPMLLFDADGSCTYELSCPIKFIGLPENNSTIHYNITINGRGADRRPNDIISFAFPPAARTMLNQDLEEATDFSGEYTLAKNK